MAVREWDGVGYDRVAAPMTRRGGDLVSRLGLAGDETVIDAGCGTGQVTALLLDRLPHGRVVAVDGSRRMLDVAGRRLGGDPRVRLVHADLREALPVDPADALVSTSTLHWVPDHPALFGRLAAVVRPGGTLAADFGGAGNIAAVTAALEELGVRDAVWTFPRLDATVTALEAAGFRVEEAETQTRAHTPGDPEALREYLRTVVLGAHLAARGAAEGDRLVRAVAARLPGGVVDYVRVVVIARRRG